VSEDRQLVVDCLPIEAISKEASQEKAVRKGHISTLYFWWARRPLVAARRRRVDADIAQSQLSPKACRCKGQTG